jgi:hypothetical protein
MLVFNWLAMPFVWFMCPETGGKSLEEIDVLFAKEDVRERILESGYGGAIGEGTETRERKDTQVGSAEEKNSSVRMEEV